MTIALDSIIPIPLKDRFLERKSAIWNTTLQFNPGEFIKIKAPSGTGKTTLVHILYKLRHDYEGMLYYQDRKVTDWDEDELAQFRQSKISIVFQDLRLFPNLTAKENIELKRVLQEPFYEAEVIEDMAANLGVSHILNQKASICSYGEQQRIAIIRALIQPFEWLIMDEPFSHLDMANTKKAADLIAKECKKRNAGLIITDLENDSNFLYNQQYFL